MSVIPLCLNYSVNQNRIIDEITNNYDLQPSRGISFPEDKQLQDQGRLCLSSWGLPKDILDKYNEHGITHMFEWQADCLCTGNVLGK